MLVTVHPTMQAPFITLVSRTSGDLVFTEEMQRAVCWYLSCDRYWEDTAPTARAFPWPLLLALATGLALALCMCYYIIWIVFE